MRVLHLNNKKTPRLLWNPKVHYRVNKESATGQLNPVHTFRPYFKIHFNIIPSGLFTSGFQTKILYATCYTPVVILDLNTLMIFGEEYKLWSFSLRNFLQSPVTSSLLGPNILFSALFSGTLNYVFPLMPQTKFHTHTKQ